MIYLDSAATTLQKPPAVARAVSSAVGRLATPGRGGHVPAMRAAETAFLCRQAAAELFQVESPEQVVFTSNATHGLNLAIHSLLKPGDAVVISGYEHNAVTRPLHALGVNVRVAAGPLFDPEAQVRAFERQLDETVRAVICNHVSNVFGFILPVEGIAALCRERGIPFVLDASSRPGVCPSTWGSWAQPLSPCRDTRDFTVPRAPACCSAGRRPTHYSWRHRKRLGAPGHARFPARPPGGRHPQHARLAGLLEGLRYVQTQGTERILTHERRLIRQAAAGTVPHSRRDCLRGWGSRPGGVLSFQIDGMD